MARGGQATGIGDAAEGSRRRGMVAQGGHKGRPYNAILSQLLAPWATLYR